ncbi:hypothetical protein BC936DRAFT_140204, partial [Jimgerdemannia flammicorona]
FFGYLRIASDEEKRLLGRKVKAEETEDGVVGKKIIGTRLYSDDASDNKRHRMLDKAAKTTSGSLGIRITGMKGDPEALECAWVAVKERQRREEEEKKEEKEEEEKDDEEEREPKIMDLKIIDFAHSKWLDESAGPDEGIVFGVGNAIKMLKRCLEEQKREKYV